MDASSEPLPLPSRDRVRANDVVALRSDDPAQPFYLALAEAAPGAEEGGEGELTVRVHWLDAGASGELEAGDASVQDILSLLCVVRRSAGAGAPAPLSPAESAAVLEVARADEAIGELSEDGQPEEGAIAALLACSGDKAAAAALLASGGGNGRGQPAGTPVWSAADDE